MPKLLDPNIVREMQSMIKTGKSLNEISRTTSLGKTTIYYHYRKYHGKVIQNPKIDIKDTESLGEFLGIIAGDGYTIKTKTYQYNIKIFLSLDEESYADSLIEFSKKFFSKPFHKYTDQKNHCIHLSIKSKEIFNLVGTYLSWESKGHRSKSRSVYLKKIKNNRKFKIGFLRGCIDTDGYINSKKHKMQFCTASKKLCRNIEDFLKSLDIDFKTHEYQDKRPNKSLIYLININSKQERQKFMKIVCPRNNKRL